MYTLPIPFLQDFFGFEPLAVAFVLSHLFEARAILRHAQTFTQHAPRTIPTVRLCKDGQRVLLTFRGTATRTEYRAAIAAIAVLPVIRCAVIKHQVPIEKVVGSGSVWRLKASQDSSN